MANIFFQIFIGIKKTAQLPQRAVLKRFKVLKLTNDLTSFFIPIYKYNFLARRYA